MGWKEDSLAEQERKRQKEVQEHLEYMKKLKEKKNYSNAIYPGDGCRRKKRG